MFKKSKRALAGIISILMMLGLVTIPCQQAEAIVISTWVHGGDVSITITELLDNGNVFLAGSQGKYEIIDPNGNDVVSGTWSHGNEVRIDYAGKFSNGNVVCVGSGGKYAVFNEDGDEVTSGILTDFSGMTTLTGFTICPNDNVFIIGHNGSDTVNYILANSSFATIKVSSPGAYNKFEKSTMAKAFSNNNIIFGLYWDGNSQMRIINTSGSVIKSTSFPNNGRPTYMENMSNGNMAVIDYNPSGHNSSWSEITPTGKGIHFYSLGNDESTGGKLSNGNFIAIRHSLYVYEAMIIDKDTGIIDSYFSDSSDVGTGGLNCVLYNDYLFISSSSMLIITDLDGNVKALGSINSNVSGFTNYIEMQDNKILIAKKGYFQILQRADDITDFQIVNTTANTIELDFSFPTVSHAFRVGWKIAVPGTWSSAYTKTDSYTFTGLIPDTLYDLRVQTRITSNSIWYPTQGYTAPALPIEINTPSISSDTINIFWNNKDNPTSTNYTLQRKFKEDSWDGASLTNLKTGDNFDQYEDAGLEQDKEYTYRIRVNAKDGNYYYSADYETFTTADPAVAAAEAARSMAEAAAEASDEARDAAIESKEYSLAAKEKAQEVYDLVNDLNLDTRLTNIESGSNVPPTIKTAKLVNNITLTRNGNISVVVDATNGKYYRAGLSSGEGEWSTSNTVSVSGLNVGVNTIYVQAKNTGTLVDTTTLYVFYLP